MTSFGNKLRRFLATTASKPCFALSIIQLVVRAYIFYVFGIKIQVLKGNLNILGYMNML